MSTALIVLLVVFFGLMILSVPIAYCIGLGGMAALLIGDVLPIQIFAQKTLGAVDSFTVLAVPFFIISGDIMLKGGIARRLVNLADILVGRRSKGGMAYVTMVASALFGAISGSAVATTTAIGGMMYPEMVKKNYSKPFAAAIGAVGGTLGILIPPSIAAIIYGTSTNTSVGNMFMVCGVVGVVACVFYCIAARVEICSEDIRLEKAEKLTAKGVLLTIWDAFLGLLAPVIILGGIYSGVFTPTEAAVIAIVYSFIICKFVYKELTMKQFKEALVSSAITTGMVELLLGVATFFSYMLSIEKVSATIQHFATSGGMTKTTFLLFSILILIILGMLMETIPIIVLTAPILVPVAEMFGISSLAFGALTVFTLSYGLFTPPFGMDVFVCTTYSKQSVMSVFKKCRWFFAFGIVLILIVAFFPEFYMWIVK